jgi:cyclophilin family peptidyl-prolyl cis-trans isomerase
LLAAQAAQATIVQFQTVMGDFEVNLYDKGTPKTVENFLAYVKSGAYTNSIIHRAVPGFVVQGGGFTYSGTFPLPSIAQNAAVVNEPVYSNRRGTIAMAKLESKVNSATSQWFINLDDKNSSLDSNNGGFTVFGEVTGNGMAIVDSMAALAIFNMGGAASNIPLRKYTAEDASKNVAVTDANLVMIQHIVILNESTDTAANLNPVKNTSSSSSAGGNSSGGGGGGSIGWLSLLMLLTLGTMRICRK